VLRATDPQGLSSDWTLSIEAQGDRTTSSGTTAADALYGSISDDVLYGLAGNDSLFGNAGNDRLVGGAGGDVLFGGTGGDYLDGGSGDDTLDGGVGADTMAGGPGNDQYLIDDAGDLVVEVLAKGAGGIDTAIVSRSYTAPTNVENLSAQAGIAIDLTGNELANLLIGNDAINQLAGGLGEDTLLGMGGNDSLDGGAGVDRMAGGAGDDRYQVDSRFDTIIEFSGEGADTVEARSNYVLPANVEHLVLLEGGAYSGGGNSLPNRIVGNSADNLLSGGPGADTLVGGLGNDTYVLTDLLDSIEDSGGSDAIRSALSIDLQSYASVERVELIGTSHVSATGNALANELVGNAGDNYLEGGLGIDTLTGGQGSDGFFMGFNGQGSLADLITDFDPQTDLLMIDVGSFGVDIVKAGISQSGLVPSGAFVKGPGAVAADADDRVLFDTSSLLVRFDADGNGPVAPLDVARLAGSFVQQLQSQQVFFSI
jgi:Ca2+-binding RTX toxin-like protein